MAPVGGSDKVVYRGDGTSINEGSEVGPVGSSQEDMPVEET